MKYLNILLITIIITSCGSTKKVIENSDKDIAKVEAITVEEIPVTEEDSITQTVEVVNANGKIIAEVDTLEEADQIIILEAFDHRVLNQLLNNYVTSEGHVDYKGFKSEIDVLRDYIKLLGHFMPTQDWSKEDKLAYWINAYNAMTIDLIVRNYPTQSIKDIKDPWKQRLWKLGEKWYNLDEIEHQIIRKMEEPRIHFALVCAAKSCPKLYNKAFTAKTLEADLTKLTKEFLADESKNNISENTIKLSKIFKWFKKDFEENGSLIDFLNKYSNVVILNNAKKSFKDYNWDLND